MQSSSLRWKSLLCAALVGMAQPACAADILVRAAADFATVELNQPWDMSDPSVVYPLLWTHNLQAATVSGRVFTGTPRDTDPHYWALYPQIPSSTATLDKPKQLIDASRYSKLSFYMWLPDTLPTGDRLGRVVWHVGGDTIAQFDAGYSESALFNVYPGWHLYTLDLASLKASPNQRWAGPWTGKMAGLRIDPCLGASATFSCNTPFKLAWVRLVDPADTGSRLKDSRLNKAAIVLSDAVDSSKSSIAAVAPGSDGSFDLSSLAPGSYKVAPIADDDYALFARGAAWDFKSLLDFNWASRSGWTLEGIKNGQFEGTLTSTGSALLLDVPASRPIDAAKYRYLRVKMDIPVLPAQTAGLLVYWGEQPVSPVSHNNFTPLKAGLNEYVIDLGQNATWTGQIRTLQINPLIGPNASGAVVKLVSVRLGKSNTAPDTTVAYLSDTVKVNNPPKINLLAPSFKSGNDYARTVLGQPWDMRSRLSTPRLDNLSSADFVTSIPELGVTGHFLRGTNTPAPPGANSSDPAVYLISQRNDKPIDASIYRLFRVKMYVPFNAADQNELTVGAISRYIWLNGDADPGHVSHDVILYPGLREVWLDMPNIWLENTPNPAPWAGKVSYLRIKPLEFTNSRSFYLAGASMHSLPTVAGSLPLVVQLSSANPLLLTVYVDGKQVAQYANQQTGVQAFTVPMDAVAPGNHDLLVCATDGLNQSCSRLAVPFVRSADANAASNGDQDSILDWAEATYPALLQANGENSQTIAGYYGRCYARSGICIGMKDGQTYFYDGKAILNLGASGSYLGAARLAGY